jgi:hypothetical protein
MKEQPKPSSHQSIDVDNASISDANVGQVVGGNLTQIQGQVVNLTVYDSVDLSGVLNRNPAKAVKPPTQQDYRQRKVLLNKVKNFWIESVLEKSLHTNALLELGLEENSSAVVHSFSHLEEVPAVSRQVLPEGTSATEVFNQLGEGRTLLILGEPGSGKTITLLKIARDLIARTEEDLSQPLPVIFNLSSWTKKKPIEEWLVEELQSKYQVSKSSGKAWVQNQDLLLLLDGLDEVKAEHRNACVETINNFIQAHGQTEIVVCSRIKDYEALSARLRLQGAICIQPLTIEQIDQYLNRAGSQLEAVKNLLHADKTLQELARTPLMLSIMSLALQNTTANGLPKANPSIYRCQLLDTYIERMFQRKGISDKQYSKTQVKHQLTWLAQRMIQESQTIFFIEKIQPTWLQTKFEKIAYRLGNDLSILLIFGIPLGIVFPLVGVDRLSNIANIAPILIFGLLASLSLVAGDRIPTTEKLNWSWRKAKKGIIFGPPMGLSFGLIYGLIDQLINGSNLTETLSYSVFLAIIFGFFGLAAGFSFSELETRAIPNQGIWNSVKRCAVIAIGFGLVVPILLLGLAALLFVASFDIPFGELISGIPWWIVFPFLGMSGFVGLTASLQWGGIACIQHFVLRLILCRNGHVPWNYARFLDYADERLFLRRVGGGYIFVHRILQEHFAQMKLN